MSKKSNEAGPSATRDKYNLRKTTKDWLRSDRRKPRSAAKPPTTAKPAPATHTREKSSSASIARRRPAGAANT
ncbi:unnamed protein product [Vitrella brassicaformis CCMP3155]|uniref:Uncharacterized protein n=1 Tax=Vitrella brassicaformis (strain CCMP3155) TaxID=1169540 RepID=A0A0G4FPY1_VITBC|nr:unnamed protein product [Vitrella brassicaformis CCMP3155]|eukprot:CEM16506.1 unnamed protein product [Vitrella brassicaformis CCMP3155]